LPIFYLASQAAGLPFLPFDLLDWAARTLPGDVITFSIDLIVSIIAAFNLGETSSAAKTAEHVLAIAGFGVGGVVAGVVFFAILRARSGKQRVLPGLLLGVVLAILMLNISVHVNKAATAAPFISTLWIAGAFIVWGVAFNRIYLDLHSMSALSASAASTLSTGAGNAQKLSLHRMERGMGGEVERLDRRRFIIRLGGATAVITVAGAGLGALIASSKSEPPQPLAWSDNHALPNSHAALQPVPGTRPEFTKVQNHYRIDINALPPVIHEEDWSLEITGMVRNPVVLTLADLRDNYEPLHQFVTLSCISNPVGGDLIGTQRWTGVSLQQILREVRPTEGANYLYITSADGFYEYVARAMVVSDERIMLTYAWDDLPLPPEHGFPLRIYIPNLYGMKQPKWITRIELFPTGEEGYWVRRGWDEVARVRATSVIDTVAVDSIIQADGSTLVPIGGIAYAGVRGISKVEVRVDNGAWQEAQRREPISSLTWVVWRYDWPFESGEHTFAIRCVDGSGMAQMEDYRDARPSGATGIHTKRRSL
jgi:DMSO/TMAO reductase YedYZ molybdopterin-dependent catalytic subunit